MDASHLSTSDTTDQVEPFTVALRQERAGVREFLAEKQRQLDEAQNRLLAHLDRLSREAAGGRNAAETARQDVDQRAAQLAREAERLDQLRAELDARRAEWQHTTEKTTRHQESLLELLQQERQTLEQRRAELERRQAECTAVDRAERDRLEQQLEDARGEQERLEAKLAERGAHCDVLRQEVDGARAATAELDALRRERDALATSLREAELRLEQAQRQLDDAENRLLTCLRQFADDLAGSRCTGDALQDVDQQAARLAREAEQLERLRADLDARRAEWQHTAEETTRHQESLLATLRQEQRSLEQQHAALERRQAECTRVDRAEREALEQQLAVAQDERERMDAELAAVRAQCDVLRQEAAAAQTAQGELDALRRERDALATSLREAELRLEQAQRQLDDAEHRLLTCLGQFADDLAGGRRAADATEDLDQQAARLAREAQQLEQLRADLDACRAEWQRTAEGTTRHQESLLATLRQEQRSLEQQQAAFERRQAECSTADRAERESLEQQLAAARAEQDRLTAELAALRTRSESLKQDVAATQAGHDELDLLLRERDSLATSLREAERRLERSQQELAEAQRRTATGDRSAAHAPPSAPADADLARRYELALDDVRELKRANARLQEQLKEASRARPVAQAVPAVGKALNWEAEKQRILAALELEFEDDKENPQRLDMEQVVERTDRWIAEKDAEIAELQQLLENQSASVGALAVGAAALGEMLDKDAIIQEERKNLAQLQEEWRAKLREAEVEVSVERAKLARQRTEVEEKLRLLEERGASARNTPAGAAPEEKPSRNRWLTRLGLKDADGGR